MKVSLLTVFVVAVLPESILAQQPAGYTRAVRMQQAPQPEPAQQPATRIEAEYRFPVSISITATGYQNGQKRENSVVVYYINPARSWVATASYGQRAAKTGGSCAGLSVYDLRAARVLVLNTREKRGMAMPLSSVASTSAERRREQKLPPPGENGCLCARTQEKKTIEGFKVEKYACTNPSRSTRYEMWVTRDLNTDLAAPGAHTELNGFMHSAARVGGVPLEGYYYENGDLISSLQLTDVNRNAQLSVNTAEYNLSTRQR